MFLRMEYSAVSVIVADTPDNEPIVNNVTSRYIIKLDPR